MREWWSGFGNPQLNMQIDSSHSSLSDLIRNYLRTNRNVSHPTTSKLCSTNGSGHQINRNFWRKDRSTKGIAHKILGGIQSGDRELFNSERSDSSSGSNLCWTKINSGPPWSTDSRHIKGKCTQSNEPGTDPHQSHWHRLLWFEFIK